MKRLLLLKLIVFVAAFLLFQIELIISKALVPGFGGSYLVWAACMLFFQTALLGGYTYSFLVVRFLSVPRYGLIQILLPFLALILLPANLGNLKPLYQLPFVIEILRFLIVSIGAAFLILSTVSVTSQNLLAASDLPESPNPYFLYGTSNLGSFFALISYPFLVEPFLDLETQFLAWKIGLAALAVIQTPVLWFLIARRKPEKEIDEKLEPGSSASGSDILSWFLLAAAGSAMFLAVTNVITFDLASIPLIWIMPLCIYLFSFYLNFKPKPWCPPLLKDRFPLTFPIGITLFMMILLGYQFQPGITIFAHLAVLFIFCMFCQNELILARPRSARELSTFYLTLAGGGAAGSALVSLAAPILTSSLIEYPAGFLLAAIAVALRSAKEKWSRRDLAGLLTALPVIAWPLATSLVKERLSNLIAALAGITLAFIYFALGNRPRAVVLSLLTIIGASLFIDYAQVDHRLVFRNRNFYGIYRVFDQEGKRYLRHGVTLHGSQYLDPARQNMPLMYYHPSAPAGELLSSGLFEFSDLAMVGLGTGSLAVYARPQSRIDFYELDPEGREVAEKYFTYLKQSLAGIRFIFGDARLSLARAASARYDLLIIDAFNSDSIPVHLVTVEAISLYRERLKPGGMILFHISNRYLNLAPMLFANAEVLGLEALYKTNQGNLNPDAATCEWLVMTENPGAANKLTDSLHWTDLRSHPPAKRVAPWTDRYSNILSALMAKE